jgi:two-component system, chemotaxis family, CheB/CheR fusion protein
MRKGIRKRLPVRGAAASAADGTGGNEYPVIVAGIGVGAGGTKSLRQFLGKIPSGLGIAYVLVLHSGPSKKILSIRQLRNLTALEVVEATEGMPVLADRIHVIPSDKFLNITGSRLTLHKPVQCDGMWMPIDHFLCTLAHDFRRRSCGIVLSGAGSDGTLGLSEIKAFGGKAFVEAPGSAEFPEMPQGAIEAGVVDSVLAAGAMAETIAAMAEQAQEEMRRSQASSEETNADLRDILNILRAKIGYDFSGYKPNTLVRRIRRRMALGRHASYSDYAGFLNEHPDEVGLLQKDLLIGVTEFFRQPQAWEFLGEKVLASIVENALPGSILRVWVPGCSTGQEAYSLAMVLTEQVKKSGRKLGIQIFATDSDLSALATARGGSYSKEEIGQIVSAERLKRFFERKDGRYLVLKQIREQIVFAPQNLTADPPFSRLDLISCRNLLMYLEQPVQQKIIVLFHFALREGGFLFLGTAESTGDREDLFDPVSKKWRIYRRIGIGRPAGIEIPVRPTGETIPSMGRIPVAPPVPRLTLASAAQQMLLDRFAPACVMIDRKLQVLYVHGKVEDYLTFPTGELTTRIVDMAREGLRARLRGAIGKCLEMKRPVSVIARVRRGEKSIPVKATVSPMRHPRETDGLLLVTFEDHRLPALKSGRRAARESDVQQLSDELKVTREELQSTIEQLESSNDQLKASNEEVTASNEELQSANEELETSKEELQSLNEELNTINARLHEKVGELEGTNNDVLNLLSSTAIATVFLDKELRVKRFTPASTRLLSLIPSDLGRPVADVLRRFEDEMLLDDARRVLTELTPLAREVQADDGRWYFRRITPYRTQDDRIEGVVLTFVDVSDIKQAEQALRTSEKKYRDLVESANSVIIRWKPDGEIAYVNRYGLSFFGYREEEILGQNAMILVPGRDSSGQDLTGLTAAIVEHPERYISNENENILSDGRRVWMQWTNKAILDEAGNVREILAIGNDITERKRAEEDLRLAHLRVSWLARFPEENPNPVLRVSAEGEALYCNPAAAKLDGWKCEIGRPTPDPVMPLVRQAMAEGREVMQDVDLGDRTYFVAVTSFPAEGYANVYGRDITMRKRAEEALQQSRERLDLALSSSAMATFEWDIVKNKRSWSGGVHSLLGTEPETFTGAAEEFFQVIHPEDRGAVQAALARAVETTGLYETEYRAVWPDDSIRYIAARGKVHRDNAGRAVSMTGVCWDITERKRAEENLQTTMQRFYNVLSGMYAAVLLVMDDGRVEFANQAFCGIFGLKESPESLNGLESQEMIEKIKNAYLQPDEAVARIGEIVRIGEPVKGEEVPMSAGRTCLRDFIPIVVNGISYGRLWHHLDISERKRAEEALREARRRLDVIVDSIADGFYALDREWRFTHVNDAALRHMGKTREEILGRTLFDVFPDVRNGVIETEYARAMESGEPCQFVSPSLITGRILEIHAYPGSDNLTILFLDVTEQQRMVTALHENREALQEANEHLEQRVRERTMELQNLTEQLEGSRHELRKLASELVMAEERERKRIAGVLHDDIAQILATVRMRLDMIHDIPPDHMDRQTLAEAKVLLGQSIQETRALMTDIGNPLLFDLGLKPACESLAKRLMERHPVRIGCEIRDAYKHLDPEVKTILYQVVRELLNNVVKHSQAQNAHVLIDMEDGKFRVKVTDDGAGFDPQTLGTPTAEGGFGLYSIRERLIVIDGSLRIESAPGVGTVVTAVLPAAFD